MGMDKTGIIRALKEMADILEIVEANPFQIMAYRNGAQTLEEFDGDLAGAVESRTLTELPGIGKGLSAIITDLFQTGANAERDRVLGMVPAGLPELLRVPRLGPKRVRRLHDELGVDNLDALEAAAKEKRVSALKGFGAATEERILRGIDWVRQRR